MKIAIIGAGISGLSCAYECEKLGVIPDVYERDASVGWPWASVNFLPTILMRKYGDIRNYLKKNFDISFTPLNECKNIILRSPNQEVRINGDLGRFMIRGKSIDSHENQLLRKLIKTSIHYNSLVDFKVLAKQYDYVVIATGRDSEARELKVWEDMGMVYIISGEALGSFNDKGSVIYLNTEYSGTGYARITPYSSTQALVGLYNIGYSEFETDSLFDKFLKMEKLENLEFTYKLTPVPFTTGRVSKFQIGNILLAGRSAGLTERFMGVGGLEAIISGIYAARSIIQKLDYETLIKPLKDHVENISSFRNAIKNYTNDDFDKLLKLLGTPGIKQLMYNSKLNFADLIGSILKKT
jgi:digeranylgeranylglycerophospholipid reductase